jgi:hypothetical protein
MKPGELVYLRHILDAVLKIEIILPPKEVFVSDALAFRLKQSNTRRDDLTRIRNDQRHAQSLLLFASYGLT